MRAELADKAAALKATQGITPCLAVILVGEDPASAVYVRNKVAACEKAGFRSIRETYPAHVEPAVVLGKIAALNADFRGKPRATNVLSWPAVEHAPRERRGFFGSLSLRTPRNPLSTVCSGPVRTGPVFFGDRRQRVSAAIRALSAGSSARGSREALVLALRRGSPLRVAWGDKVPDGSSVVEFAKVELRAERPLLHLLEAEREDAEAVIVKAELAKQAAKLLVDDTRFWVVRPRITGGGATCALALQPEAP